MNMGADAAKADDDHGGQKAPIAAPTPKSAGDAEPQFYTCGMHPWVILPEPGNCPICRMKLTPLDPKKFTGEITIDPVVTQNIGVRIEPVTSGPVVGEIRTVGTVTYDEERVRDVNLKMSSWIEKIDVSREGEVVDQGEPLFDFYSPTLYAAQGEYLAALSMRQSDVSGRLLKDARAQLEQYDMTKAQIDDLARRGEADRTTQILSPFEGVVIAKHANEGMRVDPGMRVYQIADLSRVWVIVSVYEHQLPLVQEGQKAVMTLPYIPGQTFTGVVEYIYPYLDEKNRQARIRIAFDNPNNTLKPGMFATVELHAQYAANRTLAPRTAILDTGERQVVFVSLGNGRFEPRNVRVGVETQGDRVEILDGVKPGEMVVTSGQFLLDSEARMREALAKMIKGNAAADQKAAVETVAAPKVAGLPTGFSASLATLLERYFEIGDALSRDSTKGATGAATQIASEVNALLAIEMPGDANFWSEHEEIATVRGAALGLASAPDIASAREQFANMSVALTTFVEAVGAPASLSSQVHELHCPMYRQGQGGSAWLQGPGEVRNPYMGAVMLGCFDSRRALPVANSN